VTVSSSLHIKSFLEENS